MAGARLFYADLKTGQDFRGVDLAFPAQILNAAEIGIELVAELTCVVHTDRQNDRAAIAPARLTGEPHLCLHHLTFGSSLRKQHDQEVAPANALVDFGNPVCANPHIDVNEDIMAGRNECIAQRMSKPLVRRNASLVRNKELGACHLALKKCSHPKMNL